MPRLPFLLARLPERWRYTIHNVVAHPVSEMLWQVGLTGWAQQVHDCTVPAAKAVR